MNQTRATKVENGDKDISLVVNGVKEANPEIFVMFSVIIIFMYSSWKL